METPAAYTSGYFFAVPAPGLSPALADADQPASQRTFRGVAYSGEVLAEWGERFVIDLASLTLPDPCPTLLQHDRDAPIGVCTLAVTGTALTCDGYLLTNEDAQKLAASADEGFPWQLS
ncbi:MAG: hypothetical protein RIR00_561, partial [Pseudomonadota bacterium]